MNLYAKLCNYSSFIVVIIFQKTSEFENET